MDQNVTEHDNFLPRRTVFQFIAAACGPRERRAVVACDRAEYVLVLSGTARRAQVSVSSRIPGVAKTARRESAPACGARERRAVRACDRAEHVLVFSGTARRAQASVSSSIPGVTPTARRETAPACGARERRAVRACTRSCACCVLTRATVDTDFRYRQRPVRYEASL